MNAEFNKPYCSRPAKTMSYETAHDVLLLKSKLIQFNSQSHFDRWLADQYQSVAMRFTALKKQ